LLVAGLFALAVYGFTGGPVGTVALVNPYNKDDVVAGPWNLNGHPRVKKIRHGMLEQYGVKELRISRDEGLDGEKAIRLEATDVNGEQFWEGTLQEAEAAPFADGADILYR
jgi:hypothetical protein